MKNMLCRSSLFSIGVIVSLALSSSASANEKPVKELMSSLSNYGMHFSGKPTGYSDVSVHKQKILKSEGKIRSDSIEHGTYTYQELDMYSKDPRLATVNGKPFLDHVMDAYDVSDRGPLFTLNSEMVLCWFIDESILFQVEDARIRQYLKDQGMNYNNRCINNDALDQYWRNAERDTQIR